MPHESIQGVHKALDFTPKVFGEVRFCACDVLELMEDAVRDAVLNVNYLLYNDEMSFSSYSSRMPCIRRHQ